VSQTIALPAASDYQYENFRNWFDLKNPIVLEEYDFLRNKQDLVNIGGPDRDWLYKKIEGRNTRFFSNKVCPSSF
jgi:hypothetical protein